MQWWNETYGLLKNLHPFMVGATSAFYFAAALIFLRFYRRTRDRLFIYFAAAFAILSFNRLLFMVLYSPNESAASFPYLLRLLAFALILYAIIDKNRQRTPKRNP